VQVAIVTERHKDLAGFLGSEVGDKSFFISGCFAPWVHSWGCYSHQGCASPSMGGYLPEVSENAGGQRLAVPVW